MVSYHSLYLNFKTMRLNFLKRREALAAAMEDPVARAFIVSSLVLPPERDLASCVRKVCTFIVGSNSDLSTTLYFRT